MTPSRDHGPGTSVGPVAAWPWTTASTPATSPNAWLSFSHETGEPPSDTDLGGVHEGYISVTLLHTDITHHASLASLARGLASSPD